MQKLHSIYFERKPSLEINSQFCDMQSYFKNYPEKLEIFKIGILISSPDLYKEWKKVDFQFCKPKVNVSLYKFYKRAATRSTPYGLFSTICLFNEHDEETMNSITAHFFPDAVWLDNLISTLESSSEILTHLKLSINPLVEIEKDRIILHESKEKVFFLNDFLNFVVTTILEREEIYCFDLYRILADNADSTIQPTVLFGYLHSLVNKRLLITNLRRSLIKEDSLQIINEILSENNGAKIYCNKLKNIWKLFQMINAADLIESRILIEKVVTKMEKLVLCDNYISAIGRHSSTYPHALKPEISKDINELNEFLFNLYVNSYEIEKMDSFKSQFCDIYGINVRVPVLKCRSLITRKEFVNTQKYNNVIDMIVDDIKTISLEKYKYCFQKKYSPASLSSELNIAIVKSSGDKYSLEVAPATGTALMGKMLGRFYPAFTEEQKELYSNLVECNKELYEKRSCRLVNIESLYEKAVLYNVCNKYSNEYNKVFFSYNSFENYTTLKDIYVHVDSNYDVVFTNREGQFLKFVINSALNPKASDPLIDFLINYNNHGSAAFAIGIIKNYFSSSNYIPEIKYKNIVIIPRTWRFINNGDFTFEEFVEQYKIPNFVYLVMSDNRLLLDLSKKEDYNILFRHINRYGNMELQEVNQMLSYSLNNHLPCKISEVVFEFENHSETLENENTRYNALPIYRESEKRKMDFSSQWIYIKLYINEKQQKNFLLKYYHEMSREIGDKYNPEILFYIRYNDPLSHIRLRIKAMSIENKLNIENFIFKKMKPLLENNIVEDYTQNIYIRELERYGGEDCIDFIENIFTINSKLAIQLLIRNKDRDLNELKCDMIVCIYTILKAFSYSDNEIMNLYSNISDDKAKHYFHKYKNVVLSGVLNVHDYFSSSICDLIESHDMFNQIHLLKSKDRNSIDEIAKSIIHMFCNRVFGTNRKVEKNVLACIEKITYAKMGFEKAFK